MKRFSLLFAVLLLLSVFVAGCGQGGPGKRDVTPMPSKEEIEKMMKVQGQQASGSAPATPTAPPPKK